MRRLVGVFVAGALVLGGLAGCRTEPSSSGAQGTVVDRSKRERAKCSIRSGCYTYRVTVDEDRGSEDTGTVSKSVYDACQVGARWPACKKEAKK